MNNKQLEAFRNAYRESVKIGIKGKDKNGHDIEEQSDWVWFDRESLKKLLDTSDERTGGIKMYFGQYDKDNLDILPADRKNREDYIGRISIAMVASNKTDYGYEDLQKPDGGGIKNGGDLCPPDCNP